MSDLKTLFATMLDSAAACAVQTTLPVGGRFSTLDLSVRFLKPVSADTGTVTATGRVVHSGRSTALATATANCFVVLP